MSFPPPPPPPQPPASAPGPGQPWGPQWNPAGQPVQPTLNGFAVTALVTSLVCLAPLGLIFGIVALVQISRKGQRGKGLAIAGISVSGAVLLLAALVAGTADFKVWTLPGRDSSGEVTRSGWTTILSLRTGDCFNPGTEIERDKSTLNDASVELVPCDTSHRGEAYASFTLSGQRDFPGTDTIAAIAMPRCAKLFLDYSLDPVAHGPLQTYYYYPAEQSWAAGNRTVRCWVAPKGDAELDTTVKRDASDLDSGQLAFLSAVKPLNAAGVLRPAEGPRQDLAGAKAWAGQMAEAQAETIRLLKDADLPGAQRPAGQLVAELEAGLPFWRQATKASDADTFLGHLRSVNEHNGDTYVRRIRELLDLPLPSAQPTQARHDGAAPASTARTSTAPAPV
ncbi:DUF4190 domain-containing protein [Streptomyces sp. NPDC091412]|uniref:DUF4190 domain-containing protein n=1 Tax=Streptomyces sp. NPDC091412 TaxID=3366002 RepID=UPI00380B9406